MRRIFVIVMLALGCGPARPMNGPTMNNSMNGEPQQSRVVSADILAREPVASHTKVKHILIGFRDKADGYGGIEHMDPNAAKRTREEAEALVESLMGQLHAGADFDQLMKANGEDPGMATHPDGYDVTPDAQLALEFRDLGLRLNVGEVGVTESDFGFHIMKRVE